MRNDIEKRILSVIVPVYNAEQYLDQCISSILDQSFSDFYLFLVNDGSTDNSRDICEKFALLDSRVTVWHLPNNGPSTARNFALEKVSTEWVCFVDSDDILEKDYLKVFFKYGVPDKYCLEMQGMEYVDCTGNKGLNHIIYPEIYLLGENVKNGIVEHRLLHSGGPCLKLYNINVIWENCITFNTAFRFHEDHIFYLQYLYNVKSIRLLSGAKYKYRQVEGSLTHRIHPYEQIELAYHLFSNKLELVIGKFQIEDSSYLKQIRHDVARIHVKAIRFCYLSKPIKLERVKFLESCKAEKENMKKRYFPTSCKEWIWKAILLYVPVSFQDLLLSIIINKYEGKDS